MFELLFLKSTENWLTFKVNQYSSHQITESTFIFVLF